MNVVDAFVPKRRIFLPIFEIAMWDSGSEQQIDHARKLTENIFGQIMQMVGLVRGSIPQIPKKRSGLGKI